VEYRIAIKLGFNKIGLVVVHNLPENIIKPDSDAGNSAKDSADAPILANFPRIWNLKTLYTETIMNWKSDARLNH